MCLCVVVLQALEADKANGRVPVVRAGLIITLGSVGVQGTVFVVQVASGNDGKYIVYVVPADKPGTRCLDVLVKYKRARHTRLWNGRKHLQTVRHDEVAITMGSGDIAGTIEYA